MKVIKHDKTTTCTDINRKLGETVHSNLSKKKLTTFTLSKKILHCFYSMVT